MNKKKILRFLMKHPILFSLFKCLREIPDLHKGKKQLHKDLKEYNHRNQTNFVFKKQYAISCLTDRYEKAGSEGQYFWQDLWAARLIAKNKPYEHYDIGSRIDGFIAHLSCFMERIHLIDVRPFEMNIPGVDFKQEDATNLGGVPDESITSISALCSLEHFGLGRYGDPIDPEACYKAMRSIERVLAPGGHAYISVPIGWEHLEFNAHRVFYPQTIKDVFSHCDLIEFSTTDGSSIEKDAPISKYDDEKDNMGGRFGLFHFVKRLDA